MKYRLVHLSGSLAGRSRELNAPQALLGRDPTVADVLFGPDDTAVSRQHALLTADGDTLLLRDLGSSGGTWVNGNRVEQVELTHGDELVLGKNGPRLRVEIGGGETLLADLLLTAATAAQPAPPPSPPTGSTTKLALTGSATKLRLSFLSGTRRGESLELAGALLRLGRAPGSSVAMPDDSTVSAQHAKIVGLAEGYVLIDLESTNGTFVNGQRVERAPLHDGDVIQVGSGGPELRVQIIGAGLAARGRLDTVIIPNFAELSSRRTTGSFVRQVPLSSELVIGREDSVDVRLDSPIVSKRHARFWTPDGVVTVEDLGSSNGTFLEGRRLQRQALALGDRVVVGPFQLVLVPGPALRVLDTRNRAKLDARTLTVVADQRPILHDVSLSLPPGSLTAIIGPSGSGKTTLLSALNGARPADAGEVRLNGVDLYASFEQLKGGLGYVPQDDVVHRELRVAESLEYTARLRLPPDTDRHERSKRVTDVLATLELSERRDVLIQRLSGGQRKRVSIAGELLTEPYLLFLDEPTSGLDPGLEEAFMLLLRELSYKGKTVVLVTHTLDNLDLCDRVALLVDGRLAFYGSPAEARTHFGIDHLASLYSRLKGKPATDWEEEYRHSDVHHQHVVEPLAAMVTDVRPAEVAGPRSPGWLRQLGILTRRYLATIGRDTRNAGLLLLQAPFIAVLIGLSLLYGQSERAFTKPVNTILFLLALTAVWFGCSNAARELVKERAIYCRERMVNLRVLPYVVSKTLVLVGLALVQCIAILLLLDAWFEIPGDAVLLLLSMLLISAVGICLGLALSAAVRTADRAMTLLPLLLIPQVLFTSPAVHMDMKGPAGVFARLMPSWWGFDLLRQVALDPDESRSHDELERRLQDRQTALMTKDRFAEMLEEGYPMFQYRDLVETTWTASFPQRLARWLPARLGRWRPAMVDALVLFAFGIVLLVATVLLQRRHDRRR